MAETLRRYAAVKALTRLQAVLRGVRVRRHNAKVAAYLRDKERRAAAAVSIQRALRHYRLAVCDYGRFVIGRFWRDATPASFAANAAKPNVVLANRSLASALRFVERISECLGAVEAEMASSN